MIAQKLKNNKIIVANGTARRKDAIQTIEDLKLGEFFRLTRSARNWDESLNDKRDIVFTTYESESSKVCKEFDEIYKRREIWAEAQKKRREDADAELTEALGGVPNSPGVDEHNDKVKNTTVYASTIVGTSKIIKIPSKQTIKIVRRKGLSDNKNKPNTVCIDNKQREEFFADCKKAQHYLNTRQYEIVYSIEDKDVYEKWDNIMVEEYQKGLEAYNSENNQT